MISILKMEFPHAIGIGHLPGRRYIGSPAQWLAAHAMSAVQSWSQEETRSLPERDFQARRRGLELLALWVQWCGVLR